MSTQSIFDTGPAINQTMEVVYRILENQSARIGLALLIPIFTLTILAPVIAPFDPNQTHAADAFAGPSATYPFGTDNYGRDLLSRTLYGGRTSLLMGFSSIGLALLLGVPAGVTAGFYGGKVDEVMMRALDILMSFPTLLLALMVLAALGSNVINAILAVGFVYSPRIARVVRGSTLSVKNEEFIEAAKARGESGPYIMVKEILPNVAAPIVVEGSIRIGFAIIIAASLSFLGLGAQPPTPDWGLMISQSRNLLYDTVWYLIWPSLFLGSTVMGLNLLGDGLRDVLDPQTVEE